jgi:hypothetical protein
MTAPEITALGNCPTCGQPRWQAAQCACGHSVTVHALNPKKARTKCQTYSCECKAFTGVARGG